MMFVLRGAERVWPPSVSEWSGDGRASRSQTARAWPRAAQRILTIKNNQIISLDFVLMVLSD